MVKVFKKFIKYLWDNKYILLSLIIPMLILFFAYTLNGIGSLKSVLIMDGSKQYVDFLSYLYDTIKEGHSVFYSFTKGLGGDIFSLNTYYTSSPLSFILLLFTKNNLVNGIYFLTLLKIGLSGLTFMFYLNKSYKIKNIYALLFSISYALMSYNIVYIMSLMWIDAVILLPLIALGIEKIINHNRSFTFMMCLTLALISNYYIGYMLCIFSVLYYIYYYLLKNDLKKYRELIYSTLKIGLKIILCVGLAAIIIIPTYFGLKSGKMAFDISIFKFEYNFTFLNYIYKLLIGSYDSIKTGGLPNVYVGIMPLILVILYFFNKKISKKDKILSLFFLAILYVSMIANPINLIWHGFQSPVWFPYRYSFVISFIILKLAFDSLIKIEYKKINMVGAILFVLMILSFVTTALLKVNTNYLVYLISIIAIIIYIVLLKNNKHLFIRYIMIVMIVGELFVNSYLQIRGLDKEFKYDLKNEYTDYVKEYQPYIDYIYALDNSFFRLEKNFSRSHNDNMTFNNRGISNFSSLYHGGVNKFLANLGYLQVQYWVNYNNGSTIISDSLLGVKYVLSQGRDYPYYDLINRKDEVSIYQNPYALSLGYLANKDMALSKVSLNAFEFQNYILNVLSESSSNYFTKASIIKTNIVNLVAMGEDTYQIVDNNKDNYIEFIVESKEDELYAYFEKLNKSNLEVYVNDIYYKKLIDQDSNHITTIKTDKKTVSIKLKLTDNKTYYINPLFYKLDINKTKEDLLKLKNNQLNITEFGDDYISGEITSKENKILFTTIPYETGWKVLVNGKEVEKLEVFDAFIGIPLGEGKNTVELRYISHGYNEGKLISKISLGVALCYLVMEKIYNKRKTIK